MSRFSKRGVSARVSAFVALLTFLASPAAHAMSMDLIASGFDQPMDVTSAPGDPNLFVADKNGVIYSVDSQTGAKSVFLDISSKVGTDGERGLLGLTFDPNFQSNGRFYVDYSNKNTGNTVIERYQISSSNPSVGDVASAYTLMTIAQPAGEVNHKAGWIGFRPGEPNNLYIATGDGAWSPTVPDPYKNGQNLQSDLGKILRIDVATPVPSGSQLNYIIPAGNASAVLNNPTINPEIWAYGLRNPFRASFDKLTGALWIGDVGFNTRDEVNFLPATAQGGTNFGWPVREGNGCDPQGNCGLSTPTGFTNPIFDIPIPARPGGSAIIGGIVYRGPISSLIGLYFYADYVNKTIKSFQYDPLTGIVSNELDWTQQWFSQFGSVGVSSFGEDNLGDLFVTDLDGGRLLGLMLDTTDITTPLPSTWLMLLSGFLGLGYVAHRGSKKRSAALAAA